MDHHPAACATVSVKVRGPILILQLAILDPPGLIGFDPKPLAFGFLVALEVPFMPHHFAIPLESQDVGRDAVEEPAIVADHHGAATKVEEGFFEGAKGVHIKVVCRFVEKENIAACAK
jgi:hypothetical protein